MLIIYISVLLVKRTWFYSVEIFFIPENVLKSCLNPLTVNYLTQRDPVHDIFSCVIIFNVYLVFRCVCVCSDAFGSQKRVLDSLDLYEVVSYLVWVLGTNLGPLQELSHLPSTFIPVLDNQEILCAARNQEPNLHSSFSARLYIPITTL